MLSHDRWRLPQPAAFALDHLCLKTELQLLSVPFYDWINYCQVPILLSALYSKKGVRPSLGASCFLGNFGTDSRRPTKVRAVRLTLH